jgi:hypothetical protein
VSDDTRISEIRRRLEKATPGPWKLQTDDNWPWRIVTEDESALLLDFTGGEIPSDEDADLIAHAPSDIAHLLAVHEQQAATIATLEGERDSWIDAAGDLTERFEGVQAERDAALARAEAAAELGATVDALRRAWDLMGRCADEFEPDDMGACAEVRDRLDDAILAVLAAAAPGEGEG